MPEKFKCPYCGNEYPMKHLLVNHIRQSSGDHGAKYHFPDDYKERMGMENNEEIPSGGEDQSPANISPESPPNDPETSTETKITKVDPPETPVTKDHKCPDCGTPKADWIATREAYKHEINLNYEEIAEFDYVCPKCYELIKVK
jgi:rubredoxin